MLSKLVPVFILFLTLSAVPVAAQNLRVNVAKQASAIPKACESVVPARIADPLNVPSLIREAICKGAGDMLNEYTYVLNAMTRADKLGKRQDNTTYEVFIPTLKSGTKSRGILLVTSHNGVPVPPDELEKQRLKTGERLEKEEDKIARSKVETSPTQGTPKGMLPLGMYSSTSINGRRGGATLTIDDFLVGCVFKLLKRAQQEGRDTLVLGFTPRADARFGDQEKYITQLTGEIWIDATDHIVTRLAGWPSSTAIGPTMSAQEPAVYVEMMRLRDGVWLPHVLRINGLDYPDLFDHITSDSVWTYSNYIHFSSEIKDVKVNVPSKP
jgi:hypothetical protein